MTIAVDCDVKPQAKLTTHCRLSIREYARGAKVAIGGRNFAYGTKGEVENFFFRETHFHSVNTQHKLW